VGSDVCQNGLTFNATSTLCPVAAPDHLLLMVNDTIVPTGSPILFHLTQKRVTKIFHLVSCFSADELWCIYILKHPRSDLKKNK
jgi:hypothetical protein